MKIVEKYKNLPQRNYFKFALILLLITFIIACLSQLILPPQIPLFYGLPQGSAQTTTPIWILLPSVIGLVINLINSYLSIVISDIYLKKTLAIASLAVSILALITTVKIVMLVGNI